MNADVEIVSHKAEAKLRASAIDQAKLRIKFIFPIVVTGLLALNSWGDMPKWSMVLAVLHCSYSLLAYGLARYCPQLKIESLLYATAILDPLLLSAWLPMIGIYGGLVVGFYLFTILGFGFRIGHKLMHLCQAASIAGFVGVFLRVPFWQEHGVIWFSLLVPLIIVPFYASGLITKLHEALGHAERESQAKSELLAKVSHELRTPLTGIIAATELLAAESSDGRVSQRTQTILTLSNELLCEINDLLDEAKYGADAFDLTYAPIDLSDQVALVRAALEAVASNKGLKFHTDIDAAIVDRVEGDAHHLGRVLVNLAGNAVKFTENGSVRLSIELLEQTDADYRLRFTVTDTGIGMPKAFHAKIFKPFSQVDQGVSRRYGGTGLGLALSKKIVELLGGNLLFESAPGQGSRFWFELTLRRAASVATPTNPVRTEVAAAKRILVVEDNETNVLLLKELLEIDQHTVTTCTSGMAALEILAKQEFDVILLDYNLGDMDGVRVLQTYQFGRLNAAPVLFLTADATVQTANRLTAAGGTGILYKPINLAALRKALANINPLASVLSEFSPPDLTPVAEVAKPTGPILAAVPMSPLDQDAIDELKNVSSRPEFFPKLLTEAENDITRNCQQILDALASRDYAMARDAAHALKGVSANVGAVRLVALASALMLAPREKLDASRQRLGADIQEASRITLLALKKAVHEAQSDLSKGDIASL